MKPHWTQFFESVLAPQIMLDGFLGFAPRADGFRVEPRLPGDWPKLTVDRIRLHDLRLRIRATRDALELSKQGHADEPLFVRLGDGDWRVFWLQADGTTHPTPVTRASDGAWRLDWPADVAVRFEGSGPAAKER